MNKNLLIGLIVCGMIIISGLVFKFAFDGGSMEEIANMHLEKASLLIDEEKHSEAVAELNKIFGLRGGEPTSVVFATRGVAYINLERHEEAAKDFDKVIKDEPNNIEAHYFRCYALSHISKYQEAEKKCFDALEVGANPDDIFSLLGDIFIQSKQLAKAIEVYNQILDNNPQDHDTMNQLAWIHAMAPNSKLVDLKKALNLSKKSNELTQNSERNYLDSLACIHAAKGNFKVALKVAKDYGIDERIVLFTNKKKCSFD